MPTLLRNIDTRDMFYIDWWLGSDISCQRASASFSKAVTVDKPHTGVSPKWTVQIRKDVISVTSPN